MTGPDGDFIMNPIPGQAGVDFPVLAQIPDTGFDCGGQEFPGIYADTNADCQVQNYRMKTQITEYHQE